jgi:hypothetical protein
MVAKLMRLRCAGHGAKPTAADAAKGAGVILAGTALSVLVGIASKYLVSQLR